MLRFQHKNYPEQGSRRFLLQEYILRPTLFLFLIFAGMLLVLMARHESVIIPGIAGIFIVLLIGNVLGDSYSRSDYLEIGFENNFFYMRSANEIVNKKSLKYYPIIYANPVMGHDGLTVNYIDHSIKLKRADWNNFEEIWSAFNGIQISQS
jgi:hypothetical protein